MLAVTVWCVESMAKTAKPRKIGKMKLTYFFFTFQSFCLDHRRVPSKDNQLNQSLIGNHLIHTTITHPNKSPVIGSASDPTSDPTINNNHKVQHLDIRNEQGLQQPHPPSSTQRIINDCQYQASLLSFGKAASSYSAAVMNVLKICVLE